MGGTTSIAVGCAVGIPSFVALCVALYFFVKTRKRFAREDLEYQRDADIENMNHDLSYDNINELRINTHPREKEADVMDVSEEESDSTGRNTDEKKSKKNINNSEEENKKNGKDAPSRKNSTRYVPAYRKKMKSSMTSLSNSRSSSFSNLQPTIPPHQQQVTGSNSSITSSNTNLTDHFYTNVPMIEGATESTQDQVYHSTDLAKSLHQPTPTFSTKPSMHRNSTNSSNLSNEANGGYDLKNNYNQDNEDEIQEEDQYENEFTNYTENKRAFIEGLRPKYNS